MKTLIPCFLLLCFTAFGDCAANHAPPEIKAVYDGVCRSNYHPNDVLPPPENGRVFTLTKDEYEDFWLYEDPNWHGWCIRWWRHEGELPRWKASVMRYWQGCWITYYVKVDGNDCDTRFIGNDLDTLDWSPKPHFGRGTMSVFWEGQAQNGSSSSSGLIDRANELFEAYDLNSDNFLDSFDYNAWIAACVDFWKIYSDNLDINRDGVYNLIDYTAWAAAGNITSITHLSVDCWLKYNKVLIDKKPDGKVDFRDLAIMSDSNDINFRLLATLVGCWLDDI